MKGEEGGGAENNEVRPVTPFRHVPSRPVPSRPEATFFATAHERGVRRGTRRSPPLSPSTPAFPPTPPPLRLIGWRGGRLEKEGGEELP